MRVFLSAAVLLACVSFASAQRIRHTALQDSDHDGLADAEESALLTQFAPRFQVSATDCSTLPARFVPSLDKPVVQEENGTIYGQAFPRPGHKHQVELHFYHLWRSDCGEMSHNLDAEHVSALVERSRASEWKALYWYAAAHENTLCDSSQMARAAAVDGELHGPLVWISRGKHASFLSDAVCTQGCGGDDCSDSVPLKAAEIINLGELTAPMNGAAWVDSSQWPLAAKMGRSDFTETRIARVDSLPATSIAWANPGKRPIVAAILGGNDALGGTATGLRATGTALNTADSDTGHAVSTASGSTGNGLTKTLRSVKKALAATVRKVSGSTKDQ